MKKGLFLVLLLSTVFPALFSQSFATRKGITRAVVIGISDYQDEKIPDLRYSDKDAKAFVAYLQSDKGGKLQDKYIRLLINEQAKAGDIIAQFDWLTDESRPGDKVIIYFAGHGDVERITKFQRGYLLAYDSPPAAYMAGGTLSVQNLQDIITSLSDNDVQVLFISDACRSGKLAGSDTGGAQATTAALTKQFAKEIKLLSCQPNEYSLEGPQWGGGRGCFSYHLIDGLYGLADLDEDGTVTVLELERYLEDKVPTETAPQSQIPMSTGNKSEEIASVDKNWLATFKLQKDKERPAFEQLASRNIEEALLTQVDTNIREQYRLFVAALEKGELLEPKGKSADDYFRKLIAEPRIQAVHGLLKRNFAAALQNESQEVLNALMKNDPKVWSDIYAGGFSYDYIPAYLARAIEILGERHYFYKQLKAKQAYFEAKSYRIDKYPNIPSDSINILFNNKCAEALKYDPEAAYVYLELAYRNFYMLSNYRKSYEYGLKALDLSPNWLLALYTTARAKYETAVTKAELEEANKLYKKALMIDSTALPLYYVLAGRSFQSFDLSEEESKFYTVYKGKFLDQVLELIKTQDEKLPISYYIQAGSQLLALKRFKEAESILLKAEALTQHQNASVYYNLSLLYSNTKKYVEAEAAAKKCLELAPLWERSNTLLAQFYENYLDQPNKAEVVLLNAIKKDSINEQNFVILGNFYERQGDYEQAELMYQRALALDSTNLDSYANLTNLYIYQFKKYDEAEILYKKWIAFDSSAMWAYNELAYLYEIQNRYKEEAATYKKITELSPFSRGEYEYPTEFMLAKIYQKLDQKEEANALFRAIIAHFPNPGNEQEMYLVAYSYFNLDNLDGMEQTITKSLEANPSDIYRLYKAACVYSLAGQPVKALHALEQSFEKGNSDYSWTLEDEDLENIRKLPEFKALLKRYCTDCVKD